MVVLWLAPIAVASVVEANGKLALGAYAVEQEVDDDEVGLGQLEGNRSSASARPDRR